MKRFIFLLFWCASVPLAHAQSPLLDEYIQQAWAGNQALKQQQFVLERNVLALQEAKNLFLPSVGFNANYTLAQGGRTISIPVGDLMNPVYQTLNMLTASDRFPQIANATTQFFPNDFYDAHVRISQPIMNAEIAYARKLRREQVSLQQIEIQLYKRELAKDVKVAYFRYLQAHEALKIYRNALELVRESQRVNESLVRNEMAAPTVLIRTQSELRKIEAQIIEAEMNRKNALAYCNFLLNQALDTELKADTTLMRQMPAQLQLADNIAQREELKKLATASNLQQILLAQNRAFARPRVGAQLDLGSQEFHWKFNNQSRYVLFGASIDIPIFAGFRNQLKIKQAQAELSAITAQTSYIESQLQLQVQTTQNTWLAAQAVYESNTAQVNAARRSYQDTFRRYMQGQSTNIELLDARNNLTTAELQQSIALGNVWQRYAELERAKAAYELK